MELQTISALGIRRPSLTRAFTVFALLLLVAIVFGRAAGYEFVNLDDDKFLFGNLSFLPPTVVSLAHLWRSPHAHLYSPVTMTVWWLIAQIATLRDPGGTISLNPWIFHGASLLIHAINVLLVWQLLRRLIRADIAAAIGAAIFAIHPVQVETVVWASELKDLLAAMFSLLALHAMLAASQVVDARKARRSGLLMVAIVCFLAAMLSKPSGVTLPIVAAVILWAIGASSRRLWSIFTIGALLALPAMFVAHWAQPAPTVVPPALWLRPFIAADAITFYFAKLLWPLGLAVDYGRTPAAIVASHAIGWTWIIPLILTIGVFICRRRMLIAAWLIFVAAAGANLGLVTFDFQAVSTVADHYVYFSMIGVAVAGAFLVSVIPKLQMPATIVIAMLAIASAIQVGHWSDSESLWQHAIDVNPRSGLAFGNLGVLRLDRGDAAGALPLLRRAAAIDPTDVFPPMNLVRAKLALGDTKGAADCALDLATAYKRRADFNPELTAAVLERFAAIIDRHGDALDASRLRNEIGHIRKP